MKSDKVVSLTGKSLWVVQISNPELRKNWKDETKMDEIWVNRGVAVIASDLESAVKVAREEYPNAKMYSVNKHCNQIVGQYLQE